MTRHARRLRDRPSSLRRGLQGLALTCGLLAALLPVYALRLIIDPQSLPVGSVELIGQFRHINTEQLSARAAALTTGSFLLLDVGAVQQALLAEPWVAAANVRRVWPDRIRIRIEEHRVVARWGSDALLSDRGVVFRAPLGEFANQLVWLSGPSGSEAEVLARYRRTLELIAPLGQDLGKLSLSERRAWSLQLIDGPEVMVGRADFDHRVSRWVDRFATAMAERRLRVEQVDLRYPNGFAARFFKPADHQRPDPTATAASLSR